jgi:hypothetical protein
MSFVGLFAIAAFVYWAKYDAGSDIAREVRHVIGLSGPQVDAIVVAPVVVAAQPAVIEAVVPAPIEPSRPIRSEMSYAEFVETPEMWPSELELMLETSVPIIYRGNDFGQIRFVPGQTIQVDSILPTVEIIGSVDGNALSIPAGKTSLLQWFKAKYGETRYMRLPEVVPARSQAGEVERHTELLYEIRRWCYLNFGDCTFEITDDALVLRWLATEDAPVNFRAEANMLARYYLKCQAERGGIDNYAPCEIYHPRTGRLLGVGSFFVPDLSAHGFSRAGSR